MNHSGLVLKATTTPLQTSPEHTTSKEASGGTSSCLGAQSKSNKSMGRNVAGNAIWFGQDVDRVLLSQSPKFQQVWVEGLRVLSKKSCSNGGAQQDIRVKGWRWKKGFYIVFLAGWGFLPVGPRAHELSQPRAHGVLRDFHTTPVRRGSNRPRAHGVLREFTQYPVHTGYPVTFCYELSEYH